MRDPVQIAAIALAVLLMGLWYVLQSQAPPPRPAGPAPTEQAERPSPVRPLLPPADPSRAAVVREPAVPPARAASQSELLTLKNDALRIRVSRLGGRVAAAFLWHSAYGHQTKQHRRLSHVSCPQRRASLSQFESDRDWPRLGRGARRP